MLDVVSLVLGGGRGTRLYPLTRHRSKPAVPVAGKYRLVDIPISNCINSGFNRIYVLTQFLSVSLHRHIANTYKFDPFSNGFVEILAAQQTMERADWYQGTADAVRQHLSRLQEDWIHDVLILSGDQLYRMDFRQFLTTHRQGGADITIAVIPVRQDQCSGLGIVRLDERGQVVDFFEKPKEPALVERLRTPESWIEHKGIAARGRTHLASMGIYLFKRDVLIELLSRVPYYTDFGKDLFPDTYRRYRVLGHLFDGYWEDLGTIKAYHEANLALTSETPPFNFYTPQGVIYTRMRFLPASRINAAAVEHCLISDGCVVGAGTKLCRCVLGVRSQIGRQVTVRDTVVIGADRFETDEEKQRNRSLGWPDLGIGDGSVIERAIIDKDCRIGRNVRIVNARGVTEDEGPNYVIRDGIVVIPKGVAVPDGTVI